MNWQQAITHIVNFLLLPIFVGSVVGILAWILRGKRQPRLLLRFMLAGIGGCLSGLITGWVITGRDGHMLGYTLAIVLCSLFITLTMGKTTRKSTQTPHKKTAL